MTSACNDGDIRKAAVLGMRSWHADLAGAAFGKIIAVYGHIDKNGAFVRKWSVRKMAITDKTIKKSCLSVRF